MRVGLNLTGVVFYLACHPFRNAFKASTWGPTHAPEATPYFNWLSPHRYPATDGLNGYPLARDSQGVPIPYPTFDAEGYLTNGTGQGRYLDQIITYGIPTLPPGTYNLRADGDGDWKLGGVVNGVQNITTGTFTNRLVTTISFPSGLEQPGLTLMRTNPADHVRNIQLMMPGYGFDDPLYFNDSFIASLSGFAVLRLMDWMETNADSISEYSQRALPTLQTYAADNNSGGVPYETFGELARRTGADLWVNIPRRASADWIARFGAYMLATLPATTTLYAEYGNELWNGSFQTARDNSTEAIASGLYPAPIDGTGAQSRYAARRCRQATMLLKQAFGASSARVRSIYATQDANIMSWGLDEWVNYGVDPGVTTRPLAPLAIPNAPPDSAAVSNYMGANFADPATLARSLAGGIDGMMTRLNGDLLSGLATGGAGVKALCDSYGIPAKVYEGGFENFNMLNFGTSNTALAGQPSNAVPPNPAMEQLAVDASRDPRIGSTATHELQVAANYYDLFMWFSHVQVPFKGGQYGLMESTFTAGPLAGTGTQGSTWPKWAAVHGLAVGGPVAAVTPPPPPISVATVSLARAIGSDLEVIQGTVTLSAPVPAGTTLAVTLASNTVAVAVPPIVNVAAGLTSATFPATIGNLTATGTAMITASYTYTSTTTTLALSPYHAPFVLDGAHALSTGLEVLYLFCERTGLVLHDFSGKGRHAAAPAGAWLAGPNLGAINFDGTFAVSTTLPSLPGPALTLALVSTRATTVDAYMASLGYETGIRHYGNGQVDAQVIDAIDGYASTDRTTVDATAFHTFVLVIEATRLTFYVDGVAVGNPRALVSPPTQHDPYGLTLGLNGAITKISVVALATRAWSAAEVASFAAAPTAMVLPTPARALPASRYRSLPWLIRRRRP